MGCRSGWTEAPCSCLALTSSRACSGDGDCILAVDDDVCDCAYERLKAEKGPGLSEFKVRLIMDRYPVRNGLIDPYALARRHNSRECRELMGEWLAEKAASGVSCGLCFNYALWRRHGRYLSIPFSVASQMFFGKAK